MQRTNRRVPFAFSRQKTESNRLYERLVKALSSDRWNADQRSAIRQFLAIYEPYVGDKDTVLLQSAGRVYIWNPKRFPPGTCTNIQLGSGF